MACWALPSGREIKEDILVDLHEIFEREKAKEKESEEEQVKFDPKINLVVVDGDRLCFDSKLDSCT